MFLKSLAGALLALSLAAPLAACGEQGRAQIVNVEGDAFMGPQDAKVTVDRGDVVLRGDLGRARNAVGTLATLVLPIFARAGEPVQSERVVVEPAAPDKK